MPLHGFAPRSLVNPPAGQFARPGKFGRLFPTLPPLTPSPEALVELGKAMIEGAPTAAHPNDPADPGNNPLVPAGYTYLGQFVDHDITLDTTPLQEAQVDPLAVHNFRTPALELDSVYGLGPDVTPFLYERPAPGQPIEKFLIGRTRVGGGDPGINPKMRDLPRAPGSQFALIGDPRNDENLVVQQLHLAFLKFHNKVVDGLRAGTIPRISPFTRSTFEEARDVVRWHYQWVVLHDFLPRLADPVVIDDVLQNGRTVYLFDPEPFIPVEFSVAAYRLGHSMVREVYDYNRVFSVPPQGGLPSGTLRLLFRFAGASGGDVPTPSDWIIDWKRFFAIDGSGPNLSRRLDPLIAPELATLPGFPPTDPLASLAARNLLRGREVGLPSGQAVARALGLPALTPAEVATDQPGATDGTTAKALKFHLETPLWFYILKEAAVRAEGKRLGPVGSRILAEVFVGLLEGDPGSFLVRQPLWKPTLGPTSGTFTMADLLKFVGELTPDDGPDAP